MYNRDLRLFNYTGSTRSVGSRRGPSQHVVNAHYCSPSPSRISFPLLAPIHLSPSPSPPPLFLTFSSRGLHSSSSPFTQRRLFLDPVPIRGCLGADPVDVTFIREEAKEKANEISVSAEENTVHIHKKGGWQGRGKVMREGDGERWRALIDGMTGWEGLSAIFLMYYSLLYPTLHVESA
ncbi:hypothetical protein ACLOJK_000130 [Asimina triloba]